MAKLPTGNLLGFAPCQALGLDPNTVTRIEIRCQVGELAAVTISSQYVATVEGIRHMVEDIQHYQLVPKDEEPDGS